MTDLDRCYLAAMRILDYRFNSAEELRRKLTVKQFEKDVVEATMSRLRDEKWLDDERFAVAFVRTRLRKGIGRLRIRRELTAAGVADDIAAEAVQRNQDAEGERATLVKLCARKLAALARRHGRDYVAGEQGRQKLAGYLVQQGYETALVLEVIREALREDGGS